jgi:hypothetical protein
MRIRETQKHSDPTNPDRDADLQHCFHTLKLTIFLTIFYINFSAYPLLATSVVLRMMVPPRMVRGAELGAGQTVGQLPVQS